MTQLSAIEVISGILNEKKTYHPEVIKTALVTLDMPYRETLLAIRDIRAQSDRSQIFTSDEIPMPSCTNFFGENSDNLPFSDDIVIQERTEQ